MAIVAEGLPLDAQRLYFDPTSRCRQDVFASVLMDLSFDPVKLHRATPHLTTHSGSIQESRKGARIFLMIWPCDRLQSWKFLEAITTLA